MSAISVKCVQYSDLVDKIRGRGKYQYILTSIFAVLWFVAGAILMSVPFFYLKPNFNCKHFGLLADDCIQHVCALPPEQWADYFDKNIKTLATQFGSYYCTEEIILSLYQGSTYFGALVGYLFSNFLSDNFGRRKIIFIAWFICTIGCLILVLAQSLWMASLGLFFCAFGVDSSLSITFSIMIELYDNQLRQSSGVILQAAFNIGALVMTLIFWISADWKTTAIFVFLIPSSVTLLFLVRYIKQTPMYLIREGPHKALIQLNYIGFLNRKRADILKLQDIKDVENANKTNEYKQVSTVKIIFSSLYRQVTIVQIILSIVIYLIYYGLHFIIDQFGLDIYTSETALNISELFVYYPLLVNINKIERQKTAIFFLLIASILSGVLIFLGKPKNCQYCAMGFVQLSFIFVQMLCIAATFALMNIYQYQFYPIRVRNIASGVFGVFGTTASTSTPLLIGWFRRSSISYFLLFSALGLIGVGCCMLTPETQGYYCPEELEEIKDKIAHQNINRRLEEQHQQ